MPLYRKRFKQPLSQQQTKKELISLPVNQPSDSQQTERNIPKFYETLKSPTYPEVFPRSASEPNESAYADDKFEDAKFVIEKYTLTTGNDIKNFDELKSNQVPHENPPSTRNLYEANKSQNNSGEEGKIQEIGGEISSFDSRITEPNNIAVNLKSENKENQISKKKKSNNNKSKNSRNNNKTKKNTESQFSHTSESPSSTLDILSSKNSFNRDQNTSLNSSRSSQVSMNDTHVKEAYKKFLLGKKTTKKGENIVCSQNSDVSLNDPIVKESYTQFMEKKEKFARVNTPKGLTHYDKMIWLQKQRNVGVYVHCDKCDKIRYLEEIKDPTFLPEKWYCKDNTDLLYNKCEIPQEKFPLHIQADWIDNLYNAGSLVWARVEGYPWWPGMVDDDPNTESYYWLDDEMNDTPSHYHVTFFDQKEVTRAWLKPNVIKSFHKERNNPHMLPDKDSMFKKRIDFALKQANEALEMSLQKRLEKFSFLVRYKKPINKPRDVIKEDLKRRASKLNKADFLKSKKPRSGGKDKGKMKKNVVKGQKLEPCDSFSTDFEIPPSPALENISLELFEDI